MSFKDSFDSRVLRWSGFAVAAFLAAAFALNAHARLSSVDPSATYASCLTQPKTVIR
jgi:hypothetical protein